MNQPRHILLVEGMEEDRFLTLFGQYILKPQIFDCLGEKISHNIRERGEFQLTSSIDRLRQEDGLKGCLVRGKAFDIGQPEAYLNTIVEYGKKRKKKKERRQKTGDRRQNKRLFLANFAKKVKITGCIILPGSSDNRMDRNYLKGTVGDTINALLCGCGANIRKLIAAFFLSLEFLTKLYQKMLVYLMIAATKIPLSYPLSS